MAIYKVTADAGATVHGEHLPQGATFEYPEDQPTIEGTELEGISVEEAGMALEQAADEAIAQAPTPKGFFTLGVQWRDGTTEAEKETSMEWVKISAESVSDLPEDVFPLCIDSYTVTRDPR